MSTGAVAAVPEPQEVAVAPADRDRVLTIGDQVTLEIIEDREQPVSRRVTDTGDLDVPYIGRVRARGRTTSKVASEIKRLLEKDYYHVATVKLGVDQINRAAAMGTVFLHGRVRGREVKFYKDERLTVSEAILRAGGFEEQFADTRNVRVTRQKPGGGSETFKVDVKAVLERSRVDEDLEVRDGDRIFVPQRMINF